MSLAPREDMLTDAQTRSLLAIQSMPRPVYYRALAKHLGKALSTTYASVERLERKGLVEREPILNGTLRPTVQAVRVPIRRAR